MLAVAAAAGGGLGLLYDLAFAGRREKGTGVVSGTIYVLISFLWLFLLGQYAGEGTELSFLCGCAGGLCLYWGSLHRKTACFVDYTRKTIHYYWKKAGTNQKNH